MGTGLKLFVLDTERHGRERKSRGLTIVVSDALECVNGAWIQSVQEWWVERLNVLRETIKACKV